MPNRARTVLGLHFGHDGGVSIVRDGQVALTWLTERHTRVKQAIGIVPGLVFEALQAAGLTVDGIDQCAVTTTQGYELLLLDPDRLDLEYARHPHDDRPSPLAEALERGDVAPAAVFSATVLPAIQGGDTEERDYYLRRFPQARHGGPIRSIPGADAYLQAEVWSGCGLGEYARRDYAALLATDPRQRLHLPMTLRLAGRSIPACFVNHHAAHAAGAYYQSGFASGAVLTHDGCNRQADAQTGLFWIGRGSELQPLAPHFLNAGSLYDAVAYALSLGRIGGAGKLMGLASYGAPVFFDSRFAGNHYDSTGARGGNAGEEWLAHCLAKAAELGYATDRFGDRDAVLERINVDVAASTQKVFEETLLAAAGVLHRLVAGTGRPTEAICLSGGTALSCPTNTRIARETPFTRCSVEPACDDSGLAAGAALWVAHNLSGNRPASRRAARPHRVPRRAQHLAQRPRRADRPGPRRRAALPSRLDL